MSHALSRRLPPLGLGLASVVLGVMGLMLFVLPILAIPISGCGLIVGMTGMIVAIARRSPDLRLSIAGAAVCSTALGMDFAIAYAPGGYFGFPAEPRGHELARFMLHNRGCMTRRERRFLEDDHGRDWG